MKWLTEKQVQAAAEKSERSAAICSRKHWIQLVTATAKELREGMKNEKAAATETYCALCHRFSCCDQCALKDSSFDAGCCEKFIKADDAFTDWFYREGSICTFRAAGRKLIKRIEKKFNLKPWRKK